MTSLDEGWERPTALKPRWADTLDSRFVRRVLPAGILIAAAIAGRWLTSLPALGLLVVAGGALLILQSPFLGLLALPFLAMWVPFELPVSDFVRIDASVVLIPALLGVYLLRMFWNRTWTGVRSAVNAPMGAFALALTCSWWLGNVYWNPAVPRPGNILWVQFGQWAIYVFSLIALWLGMNVLGEAPAMKKFVISYLVAGGALAVLHVIPVTAELVASFKPAGATASIYWIWMTALVTGLLLFHPGLSAWGKVLCWIVLGSLWYLAFFGLFYWVSGYLPMAVVTGVLIVLKWPKRILVLLVLTAIVLVFTLPTIMTHLNIEQEIAESGGGRLGHYKLVLGLAFQRPWFGLGMAAYRHYSWIITEQVVATLYRGAQISSHNNYIDIFAHAGIVGLGLFLWFAATLSRQLWHIQGAFNPGFAGAYAKAAFAAWIGTLVCGMLGDWFLPFVYNIGFGGFRSSVLGWLLLGGALALGATRPDERTVGI